MNEQSEKLISENGLFKVYISQYNETRYIILVREGFSHLVIKKWFVYEDHNKWYIQNHQFKQGNTMIDMEYEWVVYPIFFNTLEGLIITFTELTENFTYYFPFPKEEIIS